MTNKDGLMYLYKLCVGCAKAMAIILGLVFAFALIPWLFLLCLCALPFLAIIGTFLPVIGRYMNSMNRNKRF